MYHPLFHKIINAALILSCIFLLSCENDESKVKNLNSTKTGVEEARTITLNYTIGGKTKAILTSPLMLNVQESVPYVEFPKTLHVDFYNDSAKIESKLNAHYGRYKQYQSIVYLKDSVVVINMEKGDTLICDELYWDRSKTGNEFYTDKPVRIRTKTETINGKGMEASQDFKNWRITESVGTISVPASKFPG
ncbi:MAG: LPS export ABC transporter periplasmic protein LptC [Bacteroidota bacterium]